MIDREKRRAKMEKRIEGSKKISITSYPVVIWLLALGMVINVTGNSFLWPLNTIYITEVLGKSVSIAGFVLMLQQASSIFGNLIGGWLFDFQGAKKTIILGISMSIISVTILSFYNDWHYYVTLMLFLGFSNGLVFPSMYAMSGSVWPEGGRRAFNVIYVSQNLGVALGSTLGGIVAQISFQLIFLANAITFAAFLVLILFGFKKKHWERANASSIQRNGLFAKKGIKIQKRNFTALMIMSFSFILTWMPYVQWQTSISKFIEGLGIPLSKYTVLWTINGALIVLGQPIISFVTKRLLTTTKRQMVVGGLIFILAFAVLFNNTWYYGFVIAMIIMTTAEMLVWPAVPSAAADLAPEGKKGFYQGVVSSAAAAGRMLGFLIGGFLYDNTSMNNLLIIMVSLFFVAVIGFVNYDFILKKQDTKELSA